MSFIGDNLKGEEFCGRNLLITYLLHIFSYPVHFVETMLSLVNYTIVTDPSIQQSCFRSHSSDVVSA